jgi:hypothetical protein
MKLWLFHNSERWRNYNTWRTANGVVELTERTAHAFSIFERFSKTFLLLRYFTDQPPVTAHPDQGPGLA